MRRATGWIAICAVALVPGAGVAGVDAPSSPATTATRPAADLGVSGLGRGVGGIGGEGVLGAPDARTYAYGSGPDQRITVHPARRGKRSGGRAAILLLHGGYWAYRSTWHTMPNTLAKQGFVVLDAGYTLSPNGRWPAQFDDASAALDWTIQHAEALGVDRDRVLVLGSSAGGHLAALLATHRSERERIRGVIALSPVVDPYRAWVDGGHPNANPRQYQLKLATEELVGCPPRRSDAGCWRRWQSTTVARYASDEAVPLLMVHSEGDYVPAKHSRALAEVLPNASVTMVPGSRHGRGTLAEPGLTGKLVAWARARLR